MLKSWIIKLEHFLSKGDGEMKRERATLLGAALGLILILIGSAAGSVGAEEVPRINKEEVKKMLGNPDVVIVDIRKVVDRKIKGAVREDPEKLFSQTRKYPKNKTLILYCA